ncbi:class I SAM-dependent methyltransferase [Dendrosporobacter sp. 1207_IL3150]|uniref:class I SAM-dependent methyltransferase n=1 Tax=Dendrosporobacter sp. 1207_IL3150 TaxID=3084054 RepID=UPI002FDA2077
MNCVVTTANNPTIEAESLGRSIAEELALHYVSRKGSLEAIKSEYKTEIIIVVAKNKIIAHTSGGEFFFHPSMAELRIKNLINGKDDHMVTSMGLAPGLSLLDCTLGLATDAIVASYVCGSKGKVFGLEASPIVSLITSHGLKNYCLDNDALNLALRRINVINADYHNYLTSLPDNSFDIVYFDPMFRHPVKSSSNIKPLRFLADNRPLAIKSLQEAKRIARKRVVIKETKHSKVFSELGIKTSIGGKYSSVRYGVIETGGELWTR